MGKFLVGCLGLLLILAIAGAGVAWFGFIKPGMDFAGDVVRFGEEFQQLERSVEARSDYRPPATGVVTEDQLQRLLAVQDRIQSRLAGRMEELQQKYRQLEADLDDRDREPGLRELAGAYRDLGDLLLEAKRAQVDGLNQWNFSLAEYRWVRAQVYQALGESVAVAEVGDSGSAPRSGRVPEETVQMVLPYRDELMQTHVLAWWGF